MTRVSLTPTTAEDIAAFLTRDGITTDGMTVSKDGETATIITALTARAGNAIIAIGGLLQVQDGGTSAFIEADENTIKRHPITTHKAALRILAEARAQGITELWTWAQYEASDRWLTRLGFTDTGARQDGEKVFRWE